ncbi:hypothetical protein [uncultured Albimonas sp.]|uniref:hypothetical protein n=1 Tax=uncultured Albimonas sp. TaxID=1331701 RepID=UPI0030EE9707
MGIDDEAENAFVAGIFAPTHDRPIWIGADDLAEAGVFVDLTGNVLAGGDTNWAPGEPNDWGGDEPYVTTGTDGPWNDAAPNTG